ncbi:MAG: rRNA pseudouridine synthase [Halanaerobiales bacterium]|nr:rRNA pseudouridine synthase [Halanaerobiales bacterium]
MERLQKVMAHAGVASRRKSEEIISEGRVKVNGKIIKEMGFKVDPKHDKILVDGEPIQEEKKIYIKLNKPTGYITTVNDPHKRKKVTDLINGIDKRIYPIGRLDMDSSGLLLMTNDGDLTHKVTHPSYQLDKEYIVVVNGSLTKQEKNNFKKGIYLKEGKTAESKLEKVNQDSKNSTYRVTIHQGINRQIRRMFKKLGYEVVSLKRIRIGNISLGNLQPGEYKLLSREKIQNMLG